jgi:hypothetical protein
MERGFSPRALEAANKGAYALLLVLLPTLNF